MKKLHLIILLAVLTVLGALFTVFASNMLFSDIGSLGGEIGRHSTIAVTLSASGVAITFGLAILYLIRITKHPDCFKRISKHYLILSLVFNGLGLIGIILSVITVYHTMLSKNPFPGYLIIFTVLYILLISGAVVGLIFLKKVKEDTNKVKVNFLYGLKTTGWFLFIMLVLNRLGTFLGAPVYVYLRNLYKTFPFYIDLLVPLFLGTVEVLHKFKMINRKQLKLFAIIGLAVNVALFAYIAVMGITDTGFISSLSQDMPLERLASKPVEILIHCLAYTGVGVSLLVTYKKSKED